MPQVSYPDTLDEVTVHELTEDRIDPVPNAAEVDTASEPGVLPGLLEGGLQLQTLRCQRLSKCGTPVVAVPHDDTLSAVDQLGHDGRLMDGGGSQAEAHDDPGPGHQDVDTKAVEGLAQQHVVAEGRLAAETSAAVGPCDLPDPRDPRHTLPVLLATLLVALARGANSLAAVAAFTHDHRAWFRLWLPLGAATPSRDTYLRLVRRLDPETAVKAALWLLDGTRLPGLRELVLALDGKAARRSGDLAAGRRALHLVNAFLVREGLTLAQEPCAAKGNEITAHPHLLDRLVLEGAVVTMDAAGCQRAIVQALRAAGVDYVLALKRNQRTLHREVKAAFDDAAWGAFRPEAEDRCETVERNGGRRERRICTVLGGPVLCEWVADPTEWPGLRNLIRVQAERTGPRGCRQRSVRYYISSRPVMRRP